GAREQTRERDLPRLFVESRVVTRRIERGDRRRPSQESGDPVRHFVFACIERLLNAATRSGGSSAMIDAACFGPTYPRMTCTSASSMCWRTFAACFGSIAVKTFARRRSDASTTLSAGAGVD